MIFFLLLGLIRFGTLVEAATTTAPLPQQASYLGGTNDSTRLDLPLFVFNFGTLSYFLPSTIGTPPQPLNLTLAFGQPGVVVVGEGCVPGAGFDGCQQAAEPFNASASSTFVNSTSSASTPSVFPLVLGGSSAEAYLGNDTFTALGVDAEEDYTVGNQAVSVATESSGLFYYDGSQGIFGLGVGSTNLSLSSTLLGNRLNNGSFPYFTVGVDLGRPDISQSAPQTSDGGRVSWGGVEEGRVEGGGDSFTWMAVSNDTGLDPWSIPVDGMTFDTRSIQLGANGTLQTASLEPWFNALVLPVSVTSQIFGPGGLNYGGVANYWFVPCDRSHNVSFTIGGTQFDLDARDFLVPFNSTTCQSTIYSWTDRGTEDVYRLGAPFLRSVYTALYIARSSDTSTGISQVVGLSQKNITFASPFTNTTSPTSPPSEDGGTNVGAIVGGVIGGLALLALISFLAFFLLRRRRRRQQQDEQDPTKTVYANGPQMQQNHSPYPTSPPPAFEASQGGGGWAGAGHQKNQASWGETSDGGSTMIRPPGSGFYQTQNGRSGTPVGGMGPVGRDGRAIPELG